MADRSCKLCFKAFKYPRDLIRHLARKTPCAPILEVKDLPPERLEDPNLDKKQCRFCGRVFTSYTNMRRHVRNTCKIAPNERNGNTGMELLYNHTIQKQEERITSQQEQIKALTAQMGRMAVAMQQLVEQKDPQSAATTAAAPTTNDGEAGIVISASGDQNEVKVAIDRSQHQQNNNITVLNVFGQEQLDHVTQERVHQILAGARAFALPDAATQAVLEAAMLAYGDPAHPENLTCYLPNKKKNDALVHGGGGWEIRPVQLVLQPMMQRSVDLLFDKQPTNPEEHDIEACGEILKELETCEQDARKVKRLAGPDGTLRAVLVRNKKQLAQLLDALPVAGQT